MNNSLNVNQDVNFANQIELDGGEISFVTRTGYVTSINKDDTVNIASGGETFTVKSKLVTLPKKRTAIAAAIMVTTNGAELIKELTS